MQGTETQALCWGRGAREQPLRRGRSPHFLRVGSLSSRKGEPAASAALTLSGRRTKVPLKRRRPADRGETRVRLSGPASSLPGARAPRRVCIAGRGVPWGRELEQTSQFGNASSLQCKLGTLDAPAPSVPKGWGKEVGGLGGRQDLSAGRKGAGTLGQGSGVTDPPPHGRQLGVGPRPSP